MGALAASRALLAVAAQSLPWGCPVAPLPCRHPAGPGQGRAGQQPEGATGQPRLGLQAATAGRALEAVSVPTASSCFCPVPSTGCCCSSWAGLILLASPFSLLPTYFHLSALLLWHNTAPQLAPAPSLHAGSSGRQVLDASSCFPLGVGAASWVRGWHCSINVSAVVPGNCPDPWRELAVSVQS